MRVVGLTGGIASGKTTVQGMLRGLGAPVLDADRIYHELVAPLDGRPSALALAIEARFGPVLTASGELDRTALGARVFADAKERHALEALTHPEVARRVMEEVAALDARGEKLVVYDVPLLFERDLAQQFQGVIVVWVDTETQLVRLRARAGLDAQAAQARINAQLPLDEKRRRATWVIDNSGEVESTRAQVETLWRESLAPSLLEN